MATDEVVKALVDLADSMRAEGLAKLTYVGDCFEAEASVLIRQRCLKRQIFEEALTSYVDKLVKA